MRTCHICENIVKVIASLTCTSCRRSHCYPCIKKYHQSETDRLIPKTEEEALKRPALNACFVCLKTCQCRKCNIKESVVVVPKNAIVPEK